MLQGYIEVIKRGNPSHGVFKVASVTITNDETGTEHSGNYTYQIETRGQPRWKARGRIKNFPRRIKGSWSLLLRVLQDALGERHETRCPRCGLLMDVPCVPDNPVEASTSMTTIFASVSREKEERT